MVRLRSVVGSRTWPALVGLSLVSLAPMGAEAQEAPAAEPSSPAPAFIEGCWLAERGDLVIEEQWMAERGGSLLGMSRTVRGDHLGGYELVLIRREGGGDWVYQAHPSGQASAEFRSSEVGETSVVFANPDHDFPQRIAYYRVGPDSLIARIGGEVDAEAREIDFPYRRVACPGGG